MFHLTFLLYWLACTLMRYVRVFKFCKEHTFSDISKNRKPEDQLQLYLHIRGVSLTVSPGSANAWKATLWVVKFVVIGTKKKGGVGFLQKKNNGKSKDRHYPHGNRFHQQKYYFEVTRVLCNIHVNNPSKLTILWQNNSIIRNNVTSQNFPLEVSHSFSRSLGENSLASFLEYSKA